MASLKVFIQKTKRIDRYLWILDSKKEETGMLHFIKVLNIIVTLIEFTSKTELFDEKVDFTSVICTTQTYDIESKFTISKICKEQCLLENQKFYLQHVKMFSCFLFKTAEIKICLFYIVHLNVYVFR